MLVKQPIIVVESRPIERRGLKRATPFCEMRASEREALLSALLSLSAFAQSPELGHWQTDDYNTDAEEILVSSGHLFRQARYLRQGKQ
jgi:hypothetical protein